MAKLLDFGFTNIDLWRSEEMQLVQLMIPAESAHDTIFALGDIGLLQFKDLNADKSAFQRTFAGQVMQQGMGCASGGQGGVPSLRWRLASGGIGGKHWKPQPSVHPKQAFQLLEKSSLNPCCR